MEREQEAIFGTATVTSGEEAHGIEDSVSTQVSKEVEIKIEEINQQLDEVCTWGYSSFRRMR